MSIYAYLLYPFMPAFCGDKEREMWIVWPEVDLFTSSPNSSTVFLVIPNVQNMPRLPNLHSEIFPPWWWNSME